jgi:phosphoglycolate phosphatase
MTLRPQLSCRLFLFDLDGTLIDSRADIANSLNLALADMSLTPLGQDRITGFVGEGVQILVERALEESMGRKPEAGLVRDTIVRYLEAYEAHLLDYTVLYAGTRSALEKLGWADMAVITNKPKKFSLRLLQSLGVADLFCAILGGDSTPRKKPDPAPLQMVMRQCGVAPDQTWMVGDSLVDVRAGKAAGTKICGIAGGFRPRAELEAAGCDLILSGVADLPDHFRPTG